jgi:hypothetical protein
LSSPLTIATNVRVDGARYNIYTPTIQAPLAGGRVFTVAAGVERHAEPARHHRRAAQRRHARPRAPAQASSTPAP